MPLCMCLSSSEVSPMCFTVGQSSSATPQCGCMAVCACVCVRVCTYMSVCLHAHAWVCVCLCSQGGDYWRRCVDNGSFVPLLDAMCCCEQGDGWSNRGTQRLWEQSASLPANTTVLNDSSINLSHLSHWHGAKKYIYVFRGWIQHKGFSVTVALFQSVRCKHPVSYVGPCMEFEIKDKEQTFEEVCFHET